MPQTNYTPIQHYRSADSGSVPLAANLADGELAINTADVAVYTMNSLGTVKSVMNNPAGLKYPTADGTADQVVKTDGSGNLSFGSVQATITGAATTIVSADLTASKALVSDSSGKVAAASVTATELGYVSGVTSDIQTQINGKVGLSGDETVAGIKTFSSSPIVPTPTTSTQAAQYGQLLGVGQTWQSVTRVVGTSYTNSTGTPIMGQFSFQGAASLVGYYVIDGVSLPTYSQSDTTIRQAVATAIIPPGSTYILYTNGTLLSSVELR